MEEADNLLFMGRRESPSAAFKLDFLQEKKSTSNAYELEVFGTNENKLAIKRESAFYHELYRYSEPYRISISKYEYESLLKDDKRKTAQRALQCIKRSWLYHFHDISPLASLRTWCNVHDNRFLKPQAENLPAYLFWMKEDQPAAFNLIQSLVRQIAPFFEGFQLEPQKLNPELIRLEWKERNSETFLNAMSMSGRNFEVHLFGYSTPTT